MAAGRERASLRAAQRGDASGAARRVAAHDAPPAFDVAVLAALAALPAERRAVIVLRHLLEHTPGDMKEHEHSRHRRRLRRSRRPRAHGGGRPRPARDRGGTPPVMIALAALVLLLGGAGDARTFENDVYGHSVLVPPGWTARLSPDGTTNVVSSAGARLDRLGNPPPGQVRVIVADFGRRLCKPGSSRPMPPDDLGPRTSFEGFPDGFSRSFCLRGHSFQVLVPVGRSAPTSRLEEARRIVASIRLTARAAEVDNARSVRVLGRSVEGRPIRVWRVGNAHSPKRILVVGCIHGSECAGLAVTRRLVDLARPVALDLWVIQNLNPDGLARATRGNSSGVDLNRDFLAATQRETRIARMLILRIRPDMTIWFHQPQSLVRAWGPSRAVARRYARLAGVSYRTLAWPPGSASRWESGIGLVSFVVELPAGELPSALAFRHARAILRLAE